MITLGVVADSHIPDRMSGIPPAALAALSGVDAILHAGDLSTWRVVEELEQVAPVYAVAGNRDFFLRGLPLDRVLAFDGVRIGLTHGHGGWRGYLREKLLYYTVGFQLARYRRSVRSHFDGVQAIVFGHTHRPANERYAGVLLFNPGSLGPDYYGPYFGPAVGRLTIGAGRVTGEIIPLG